MKHGRTLSELFSFPGFRARLQLSGLFGDPQARIVDLARRKKRWCVRDVAAGTVGTTTARCVGCGIRMRLAGASTCALSSGAWTARPVEA